MGSLSPLQIRPRESLEILLREMKKSIFTHKTGNYTVSIIALGLFVSIIVFPIHTIAHTTSLSHSVSISSTDNSASQASVKTTVNGVVVEDSTVEGVDTINTQVETVNGTTTVYTVTDGINTSDEEIFSLMQRLKVLLDYYVSLLNERS